MRCMFTYLNLNEERTMLKEYVLYSCFEFKPSLEPFDPLKPFNPKERPEPFNPRIFNLVDQAGLVYK